MKKTIITVATTGAWPKKENNPNVPMTPAEEWAGRQYPGMEDPLRGLLLDHLLGRVRRALDGMARSRAPAEARRRELEQVLEGLMEMRKEWDAWQQR